MMPDQLAPYAEKYPTAPEGWEPLASAPLAEWRAPIEYLMADGSTLATTGISNLYFVCHSPIAWRRR